MEVSMPGFLNPFTGMVPERKLTKEELVRALRQNLSAEEEATHLYMAHADATDHPLAKAMLIDIANEERVHVGEFARLIAILSGDEDAFLAKGAKEVDDMALIIAGKENPPASAGGAKTVGSLKE
jgi:rubrerythrin